MSEEFCNNQICCDRGLFHEEKCICDYSFFGDHCEQAISEIYIPQYYVFIGLSCIIFLYSLINALYQLYSKLFDINQSPQKKIHINISILIASPFNIILTLSIIFSILKLIWLIIDPFQLYRGKTIIVEHILNDITYTILFYIYGYLLIVWYSMYDEVSFTITDQNHKSDRKYIFKYYKIFLKLRLFIILLVQLVVSIFTGLRKEIEYPNFIMGCYIYLLINFLIFICEFIVYGNELKKCITFQLKIRKKENQDRLVKLKTIKEQLQNDLAKKQAELNPQANQSPNDQSDDSIDHSGKQIKISPKSSIMIITELAQLNNQSRLRKKNVTFCKNNNTSFSYYRQESHHTMKVPSVEVKETIMEQSENSEREAYKLNESCCLKESAKDIEWNQDSKEQSVVNVIVQKKLQTVKEVKTRLSADFENNVQTKNQVRKSLDQSNMSEQSSQEIVQYTQVCQQMIEICSYQKNLEKHSCEVKQKSLQSDKIIIDKISLLISFGVFFLILFGIMSVIALLDKKVYSEPKGTITYMYLQSFLQFFSLLNVLKLFRDFHTQDIKNLIWIQKVGNKNNDLNQNYSFIVPQDYKQNDEMLQKFETRINMITLY